ncbi:hypothetical protein LEP1GSC044_3859 [Leptospira kirschneri serovar Grippotyphosa str. RM52]|nr:hypothetical protein LEP1GSC044_3859 [Leptospira kirschneri serovar Grippotyphosa str. RM52]EMK05493.1 hypothetical protein LEP1GSC176_2897 [Leptospira kirschneri str. MMD1493]
MRLTRNRWLFCVRFPHFTTRTHKQNTWVRLFQKFECFGPTLKCRKSRIYVIF